MILANRSFIPAPGVEVRREEYKSSLQYYRHLKRLSQSELAEQAGVNFRTLQEYEQGRRKLGVAQAATLARLASALDVDVSDLLKDEQEG